ncbi:MAG: SDR family oxidoreductase [Ilumatobacteraceae bacterium]
MARTFPFTSALITGASSGIGEAMSRLLGEAGVPQVVVARRTDRLEQLAGAYPGVEVLGADLTTPGGIAAVEARIIDERRPIDLVVNNAGFGTSGAFVDLDPDRLDDEVRLNVGALTRLSRAALGVMVPRRRGYLLNVSSVVSFQPGPLLAVYAATKAYVTSLSESLHEEVRGTGVKVTALCPGLTRTEFQSVSNSGDLSARLPSYVWQTAAEVAEVGLRDVATGKALSIPGTVNKTMVAASGITPRGVVRRMAGLVRHP